MNQLNRITWIFLFVCTTNYAQVLTVLETDSLLYLAQNKLEHKKYARAKALSQQLLQLDSIVKPNTTDVKMAHFYKHSYDSYIWNEANFICGESMVYLKEYDSALVYLKKVTLPFNYGGTRAFSQGIEVKTKLALLISICYEKTSQKQQAVNELIPLLFIDREFNYLNDNYSHKQVIIKLNQLIDENITLDSTLLYLDTSFVESATIYGYSLSAPPVYYRYKEMKIYILPRTELVSTYNNCIGRDSSSNRNKTNEHPFLSDSKIKYKLHKQQMIQLLLQFDYFRE